MLAFLSSSWDILLASQSLSRVLFRIPSVPTSGRRASRFLGIGLCFSVPRLPEQFWDQPFRQRDCVPLFGN